MRGSWVLVGPLLGSVCICGGPREPPDFACAAELQDQDPSAPIEPELWFPFLLRGYHVDLARPTRATLCTGEELTAEHPVFYESGPDCEPETTVPDFSTVAAIEGLGADDVTRVVTSTGALVWGRAFDVGDGTVAGPLAVATRQTRLVKVDAAGWMRAGSLDVELREHGDVVVVTSKRCPECPVEAHFARRRGRRFEPLMVEVEGDCPIRTLPLRTIEVERQLRFDDEAHILVDERRTTTKMAAEDEFESTWELRFVDQDGQDSAR